MSLELDTDFLFVNPRHSFLTLSLVSQSNQAIPKDLSISLAPILLSVFPPGNWGRADDLFVSGTTVFIANNMAGLQILNVSNLLSPYLLSSYPSGSYTAAVVVSENVAYVADGWAGLKILNVSNLSRPFLLSTSSFIRPVMGVAVAGMTIYVANEESGLQILDASNITHPRLLGTCFHSAVNGLAYGVAVSGTIAYVANWGGGLQIWDVSNATHPLLLSIYIRPGGSTISGLAISGTTVYLADVYLQILDVSNPADPRILNGYYNNIYIIQGIAVSGTTLYVADSSGLQVLDVSNAMIPRLLASYSAGSGQTHGVAVSGTIIYVADTNVGLQILDSSQWTLTMSPTLSEVGNYPLKMIARDDLGGESTIDFTIRVEGPPRWNGNIPLQQAWVGQPFTYFVPSDLFVDPNDDVMSYSARLVSGKSLPSWLQFNPLTIGFGGMPQSGDAGNLTIILSATDNICHEIPTVNFTISVDFLPVLSHRIANQLAPIGQPYQFFVPKNSFYDPAGLALSYLAQGIGNQPLPGWLQFNAMSLLFSGVANTANITIYTLQLIAANSAGGQVIASFTLRTDHFPVFNKLLSLPIASVNQPWIWTLPNNAFTDMDGDPLVYFAAQENGSPLPSWLSFNPITAHLPVCHYSLEFKA